MFENEPAVGYGDTLREFYAEMGKRDIPFDQLLDFYAEELLRDMPENTKGDCIKLSEFSETDWKCLIAANSKSSSMTSYGVKGSTVKKRGTKLSWSNGSRTWYVHQPVEEGDSIIKGSSIDLILGRGLSNDKTVGPELIGLSLEEAKDLITARFLNLGAVIYDGSIFNYEDSSAARVWKQRPLYKETQLINLGASVDIWLTVDSVKLGLSDTTSYELPAELEIPDENDGPDENELPQ